MRLYFVFWCFWVLWVGGLDAAPPVKWEYIVRTEDQICTAGLLSDPVRDRKLEQGLSALGAEGWELVAVIVDSSSGSVSDYNATSKNMETRARSIRYFFKRMRQS